MASLKAKLSFSSSIFEIMGLIKLGIFYGDDLDLSSWWSGLAGKLAVYRRMEKAWTHMKRGKWGQITWV